MRTVSVIAIVGAAAFLLSACSSYRVNSDYDKAIDFSKYSTYTWIPAPDPTQEGATPENDGLVRRRIERAVNRVMTSKGLRQVDNAADANLLLNEHISVDKKLRVNTTNYGYGYGRWGYYGGAGPYNTTTHVDQYEEGTLMIDLIDASTKELVWRGSATTRLKELKTPEEREAQINKAVNAILEKYPPPPPKN